MSNFKRQHLTRRLLKLVIVAKLGMLSSHARAQVTGVDLNSPALSANAQLPKYFRSGPPLAEALAYARSGAGARGIAWKGLQFIVYDAENLAGFTSAGAVLKYRKLACQADGVVIGHTNRSVSHLSAYGSVYTDYELVVDTWLKTAPKSQTSPGPAIVVTRPGGSLVVANDPVSFEYEGFPELKAGATYLQFVQYIPTSQAYQAIDPFSTLISMGNDWVVARGSSSIPVSGLSRGVLETELRTWLKTCSN